VNNAIEITRCMKQSDDVLQATRYSCRMIASSCIHAAALRLNIFEMAKKKSKEIIEITRLEHQNIYAKVVEDTAANFGRMVVAVVSDYNDILKGARKQLIECMEKFKILVDRASISDFTQTFTGIKNVDFQQIETFFTQNLKELIENTSKYDMIIDDDFRIRDALVACCINKLKFHACVRDINMAIRDIIDNQNIEKEIEIAQKYGELRLKSFKGTFISIYLENRRKYLQ
jgi:hypothetical protein